VFNRRTGQGLHDLAVGSYVIRSTETGPIGTSAVWKPHWFFAGVLLASSLVAAVVQGEQRVELYPELMQDLQLVEGMDSVVAGGVSEQATSIRSGGGTGKTLEITVWCAQRVWSPQALADKVAGLILQNDKGAHDYDQIRIVVSRGYDLGFAHSSAYLAYKHSPAEWSQRLSQDSNSEDTAPTAQ